MRARDKIRRYDIAPEELDRQVEEILGSKGDLETRYEEGSEDFTPNKVVTGKIVDLRNDEVIVDIGYKSEGIIPANEFEDINDYDVGDRIEVLLESVDEGGGGVQLSKRKADRIRGWERVVSQYGEGATVRGRVLKKIKGGLLVDIGVPVFLPASQVSIRRTHDISDFIGRDIEARIIKIDQERMNIVISRRRLIEEQREEAKKTLLKEIKPGQIRAGVVKNIADFGAFVDLGGIDGLLHITDMSWSRLTHPSDMLKIDDEVEIMVLRVDLERERIALGLKQKFPSPWETVELKYPVGSRVQGSVVNVMPYGAFVKLEDGIEGLVHISEMSWSKRINHPEEVVKVGDEVEVVVLDINRDKQEISLGMKQADGDPWDDVEARFPPGTVVEGTVRNLTSYGAFVEIDDGIDGLLHVSDMSWTRKIQNPAEVLDKGAKVQAVVLSVHPDKKRIALGLKQLELDPWQQPEFTQRYGPETEHVGAVTKVTNFGIFIGLEEGLEGLLHISELTPADNLQPGARVAVRVLRLDGEERKIGLALIRGDEGRALIEAAGGEEIAPTPAADGTPEETEGEAPASSEATETPESPEAPETAEAPEAAGSSETPETPETPETAEAPVAPESSDGAEASEPAGGESPEAPVAEASEEPEPDTEAATEGAEEGEPAEKKAD